MAAMLRLRTSVLGLVLGVGLIAAAQTPAPCTLGVTYSIGNVVSSTPGSPFTATVKTTFDHKLPDGNSIHGESRSRQARDATGKTLRENAGGCERGEDGQPHLRMYVTIYDPVAKTTLSWQVGNMAAKVAHLAHQMPPKELTVEQQAQQQRQIKMMMLQQPPPRETRTEQLGSKLIHGIEAEGTRTVRTIPAGEEGNAQPLEVLVREEWRSKELGIGLSVITDDPRYGRVEFEYEVFKPGEPDASLFAVPDGYTVEEQHLLDDGL